MEIFSEKWYYKIRQRAENIYGIFFVNGRFDYETYTCYC